MINKLQDHKLLQICSPIVSGYIAKQNPDSIQTNPDAFESRAINIMVSSYKIIDCLNQLHFTVEMLSGFQKKKKNAMNRSDYIIYMIENFYLRITSIFDRSLRFSNLVFNIGLPDKECRESTIIQNEKISGTKVEKVLKKIGRAINRYKSTRNQIAHQDKFSDKEISQLEIFYYLIDSGDSSLSRYKNYYKVRTDKYVYSKKKEYKEIINQIEELINEYFTSLIPYTGLQTKK